eukprot:COSAG01_NODE_3812_length_5675_cov_2.804878_3_plen_148_part_00
MLVRPPAEAKAADTEHLLQPSKWMAALDQQLQLDTEIKRLHDFRWLIWRNRLDVWLGRGLLLLWAVPIMASGVFIVVWAELTLLGVFLYPTRCAPIGAAVAGVFANVISLKQKLLGWFDRVEAEIKEVDLFLLVPAGLDRRSVEYSI